MPLLDIDRLLPDPLQINVLGEPCLVRPDIEVATSLRFTEAAKRISEALQSGDMSKLDALYEILAGLLERQRPRAWWERLLRRRRFTVKQLQQPLGLARITALQAGINEWLFQTAMDEVRKQTKEQYRHPTNRAAAK
jgi:hypothetical protein